MIIKIGDTITDERGRTGTVEQIGIGKPLFLPLPCRS